MFKKRKGLVILCVLAVLLAVFVIWIAWGNQALMVNTYRITSGDLPKAFDGFRIAQLSDLHNCQIGKNNEKLISMLQAEEPDIIVITGDMIDSRQTDVDIALHLAGELVQIAPCYYVSGNHEARVSEYDSLKAGLIELGVTVLENAKVTIELSGETITLAGVVDPSFKTDYLQDDDAGIMGGILTELLEEEDGYTILLSHRPELFEVYAEHSIDLIFSGHAHGGQFRIPFIGGLIAPNQGLFPQYDAGIYEEANTTMVVSRGIGNSIVPFRINNRPEIVLVELALQGK